MVWKHKHKLYRNRALRLEVYDPVNQPLFPKTKIPCFSHDKVIFQWHTEQYTRRYKLLRSLNIFLNSPRYHCYRQGCEGVKIRSLGIGKAHEAWLEMLSNMQPTDGFLRGYKEILIRQAAKENERINDKVKAQREVMSDVAETRLDAIEDRLMEKDERRKQELSELIERLDTRKLDAKDKLDELEAQQTVQEAKITYAINHMHDIAKQWLDADYDLRVRFQTMLFPQGTTFNMETMRFGTEKISPLYRYITNKKDLSKLEKSSLVTLGVSIYNAVVVEIIRWNEALKGIKVPAANPS